MNIDRNKALADIVDKVSESLKFTILEIGAMPLDNSPEPFHCLLDFFPSSRICAFEVDETLCEELNMRVKTGLRYYPAALGRTEERRSFYETNHPMCSSFYKANDRLNSTYNSMEVAL